MSFLDNLRQCFLIPKPDLTEKNLPDQSGRVFIVTGGYTGVGKELCKILYQKNGTIYIAGRSQDKAEKSIEEIKTAHPSSDGRLEFLKLDLADLPTVRASAEEFLGKEQRLDVLTNNAGVMMPPVGSTTAQSYELQMGTNCLGPYLFTVSLLPLLRKTAASSPPGAVRVTWAASLATAFSPPGGVRFEEATHGPAVHRSKPTDYAQSKACNVLLSREFARRHGHEAGIVSNAWNPGNLRSELQRHTSLIENFIITYAFCYPPVYGGYTELFAGWSEAAGKPENDGKYIGPWGRFVPLRKDVDENQAGASQFWEWCEEQTKQYRS